MKHVFAQGDSKNLSISKVLLTTAIFGVCSCLHYSSKFVRGKHAWQRISLTTEGVVGISYSSCKWLIAPLTSKLLLSMGIHFGYSLLPAMVHP